MRKAGHAARALPRGGSLGGWALLYMAQRARWDLTGIGTLKELLSVMRLAPTHAWPVRKRRA